MIGEKTVLAVIPARGGSKGLPKKNVLPLAGVPLIGHTIQHAHTSAYIDRIICSTDCQEIADIATAFGAEVPFLRPRHLAGDETTTPQVLAHLCSSLEPYDLIVVLQPTSPLRIPADIDECIRLCNERNVRSVATVCESDKNPAWMFELSDDQVMRPILGPDALKTRRQDLATSYVLNGAVYVFDWEWGLENKPFVNSETLAHVMPKGRSIDIDTSLEFDIANFLLERAK